MPRSIWSGALSFGLVNVPVKVVTAVSRKDVRFNQLHEKDGGRIEMKRFCSAEDKEVPYEEIVKGYKVGPDQYVTITADEMDAMESEKSDAIEIVDFVDLTSIDPVYFEKPYYLVPQKGASKSYGLLVEAMRRTGRVAIARVVMRTKEHLVAVRPVEDALVMTTLLYDDELVKPAQLELPAPAGAPAERELEMAEKLIGALAGDFEPSKYADTHRERILELIEAKAEGREIVAPPKAEAKAPADLVDALQASIEAAQKRGRAGGAGEAEA